MRRNGSITQLMVAVAGVALLLAGSVGAYWWWSHEERDPRAQEMVRDAESVVAAYYVAHPHPQLGNWERMTGSGYDHVSFSDNPHALRAVRTAHFTNGFSGNEETVELLLLIVPPQPDEVVNNTTIRTITNEGRQFVIIDPRCGR